MATTTKLIRVLAGQRLIQEVTATGGSSVQTSTPHVYRGNGSKMKFGIFLDEETPLSLSDLTSITYQFQVARDSGTVVAEQTIAAASITDEITVDEFNAGTAAHFELEWTGAEMNPSLGGEDSVTYWVVIHGIDDEGEERTYAAGLFLTIEEDGSGANPGTPSGGGDGLTGPEVAALIETNVGLVVTGTILGGEKTATISWGKTLSEAPTHAQITGIMTDASDTPQPVYIVAESLTITGCSVTTTSTRHSEDINVTVQPVIE